MTEQHFDDLDDGEPISPFTVLPTKTSNPFARNEHGIETMAGNQLKRAIRLFLLDHQIEYQVTTKRYLKDGTRIMAEDDVIRELVLHVRIHEKRPPHTDLVAGLISVVRDIEWERRQIGLPPPAPTPPKNHTEQWLESHLVQDETAPRLDFSVIREAYNASRNWPRHSKKIGGPTWKVLEAWFEARGTRILRTNNHRLVDGWRLTAT